MVANSFNYNAFMIDKNRNPKGRNQHTANKLTHNGKTKTTLEWAKEIGISYQALYARLNVCKWPMDKSLSKPLRVHSKRDVLEPFSIPRNRIESLRMSFSL